MSLNHEGDWRGPDGLALKCLGNICLLCTYCGRYVVHTYIRTKVGTYCGGESLGETPTRSSRNGSLWLVRIGDAPLDHARPSSQSPALPPVLLSGSSTPRFSYHIIPANNRPLVFGGSMYCVCVEQSCCERGMDCLFLMIMRLDRVADFTFQPRATPFARLAGTCKHIRIQYAHGTYIVRADTYGMYCMYCMCCATHGSTYSSLGGTHIRFRIQATGISVQYLQRVLYLGT